jgi:hypothetical protein
MQWIRVGPALVFALMACGQDGEADSIADLGPTACEIGPGIARAAIRDLHTNAPACVSDDECVMLDTKLRCRGYARELCGDIVHRAAAARWSADDVCTEIEDASLPSDLECATQASCANPGRPVCRAGECVGSAL